jgi:hypothetical protein
LKKKKGKEGWRRVTNIWNWKTCKTWRWGERGFSGSGDASLDLIVGTETERKGFYLVEMIAEISF